MASSNLAFFSESRIRSVSARLGHTKLLDLIETIGSVVDGRLNRGSGHHGLAIKFRGPSSPVQITADTAASYIEGTRSSFSTWINTYKDFVVIIHLLMC